MPRVNQGIFNQLIREFNTLIDENNELLSKYYPNNVWNVNYDFFTDFVFEANDLYKSFIELENKINALLSTIKFEETRNLVKYKQYRDECQSKKEYLSIVFSEVLSLFVRNGTMTNAEQETLNSLEIYKK